MQPDPPMIELPPLPEPYFENHDNGDVFGCEKTYFHTAAEMRSYGEACARAALGGGGERLSRCAASGRAGLVNGTGGLLGSA